MECDAALHPVIKKKYRFSHLDHRIEIDIYPFSDEKAVLFIYGASDDKPIPPEDVVILKDVTGDPEYKNRCLAGKQQL